MKHIHNTNHINLHQSALPLVVVITFSLSQGLILNARLMVWFNFSARLVCLRTIGKRLGIRTLCAAAWAGVREYMKHYNLATSCRWNPSGYFRNHEDVVIGVRCSSRQFWC